MAEEKKTEEKPKESKYKGYKPQKGVTPPWDPFNPENRKKRMTIKEKKFLYLLSQTGSMSEAFRGTYKIKAYPDKKIEAARVGAMANQVLTRLKAKSPELVQALTFEDITPKFVREQLLKLYEDPQAAINDKIRLVELMGKLSGEWTEKRIITTKIQDVTDTIYTESDQDFPDHRLGREDIEKIGQA